MEIRKNNGFSLAEIVLGLVVMSIAMTGIVSLFFLMDKQKVDPFFEVKSNLLASRIISQIQSVDYDEKSDHKGSICRCGEQYTVNDSVFCNMNSCSLASEYGLDNNIEKQAISVFYYNDIDDFDTKKICSTSDSDFVKNSLCSKSLFLCSSDEICAINAQFFISKYDELQQAHVDLAIDEALYSDYWVSIIVTPTSFKSSINGTDISTDMKNIEIYIQAPNNEVLKYHFYRGNY